MDFQEYFAHSLKTKPEDMYFRMRFTCTCWTTDVLAEMPLDDLFVVGDTSAIELPSTMSVEIENISVRTFDELRYLLGLSNYVPDS